MNVLADSAISRLTLAGARAACREAEREGLLGMYPQAALRLEHELNCALANLAECHLCRDSAIRAAMRTFAAELFDQK